jgi:SAM-dependent methyltransferase
MKRRLLKRLACPNCSGSPALDVWRTSGDEIVEGLLRCDCGEAFPVIGGVPRMLTGDLRDPLFEDYASFFSRYGRRLPARFHPSDCPAPAVVRETQRSFGFEWSRFSRMLPVWEKNFWDYMAPHTAESFRGKTVLDAGCGMGRHLYYVARYAAEAIGMDFSRSVDAAYGNTCHLRAAHVVQGDLLHAPFRPASFDLIYCLGVLHHLPDPEEGLRSLLRYLKPGGELRIYVYWDFEGAPRWKRALVDLVALLRRVTTRLPHRVLTWLCYPIAAGAWLSFVAPYRAMSRSRLTKGLAETLPLRQYADYPFSVLVNDQFDRFSAPLEKRYGETEICRWLRNSGLEEVRVMPHWGWLGHGRKRLEPAATGAAWPRHASFNVLQTETTCAESSASLT